MPEKESVLRHITGSENFQERRKTARLDVPVDVSYKTIGEETQKGAVTKNVSVGGCLLLTKEELHINSELELEIVLGETESEALKLKGRIVRLNRQEEKSYEYGIAFDTVSKDTRRLFADFFFSKMYEMVGLPDWPTKWTQVLGNR